MQGILAALYAAKATGQGQHVDISMYEAMASLLTFNAGIYFATSETPRRRGNDHPTIVPYETFEASDGWINLGVANDDLWQRFCRGAERPDLAEDARSLYDRRFREDLSKQYWELLVKTAATQADLWNAAYGKVRDVMEYQCAVARGTYARCKECEAGLGSPSTSTTAIHGTGKEK